MLVLTEEYGFPYFSSSLLLLSLRLNDLGFVIYPGKVSNADCFRIGHIGRLFPDDTQRLVDAITQVCKEMKTACFAPGYKAKL